MKRLFYVLLIVAVSSCATPIPTTISMNDFVMMSLKTNPNKQVVFEFNSIPTDGEIKVYQENRESNSRTYNHTIPSTVRNMLGDFMSYRFSTTASESVNLGVTLRNIEITFRPLDSGGKQVAVALFGGELSYTYTTKLVFDLSLLVDGKDLSRSFAVSSEDTQIQGVGTGTSTSNFYRGKDSVESLIGRSVDQTNNKFLMLLNNYLLENGL